MKLTRRVLCLDWDKRSLRIVVARVSSGRAVLEDAHSHRLPNTVDADDPQSLGEFIQQMLQRHRLHHRKVVVDVPRERAVIHRLTLPPTPTEEVAAAVRFQAMKELPFPVDSAALDYVVMARDENGQAVDVLLAAVTLETLERVKATCAAAGLTPTRIGLRPYANLVSIQHVLDVTNRRVLFVDVGPGATEIDVIHGETLAFARSANVNVPLPLALSETTESGEPSRVISIAELADVDTSDEAVEAAGEELLVEVTRTLQAYRATEPEGAIDQVLVAGGTGIEPQLVERLHTRLGYTVELFDPTEPLGVESTEAPKLRSFAAALGLAWGLSREGLLALDFLNPKQPVSSREIAKRRVRIASMAVAIVVIAAAGVLMWQYRARAKVRDDLIASNAKLWEDVQEKTKILNRIDEADEWAVEAIWPEELLTVTRLVVKSGADPGKKSLVREIDLDAGARRPAIILRDLFLSDWEIADKLQKEIAVYKIGNDEPYEVSPPTLTPVDGLKFTRKLDLRIDLKKLYDYREGAEARDRERRNLLKKP